MAGFEGMGAWGGSINATLRKRNKDEEKIYY